MSIYVVTPPTAEPVTIAEVKQHLRLASCDGGDGCAADEDVELLRLIAAARRFVEGQTDRAFVSRTVRETLDGFRGMLRLSLAPVRSLTSIAYIDGDGTERTIVPADYVADLRGEPVRITPTFGSRWPTPRRQIANVSITYVAGYGDPDDVPEDAKVAISQLAAHWYANREAVNVGNIVNELPLAFDALISSLRWSAYL